MMAMINKPLAALIGVLVLLCGCRKHQEVFFDTPFVRIEDSNGN